MTLPSYPSNDEWIDRIADQLDTGDRSLYPGELLELVRTMLASRSTYLDAVARFGTPQYLVEEHLLFAQTERFLKAFSCNDPTTRAHYAFKANPTLCVVQSLRRAGLHADVSSGLELALALRCGFERIVLSGPAKSDEELSTALDHADRVTVHLDSLLELERLEAQACRRRRPIDVGIRLNTKGHGAWTKFGIPLDMLPEIVRQVAACRFVRLRGVQFHLSWNRRADGYLQTLAALGPWLASHAPADGWRFVDIGGGYYPEDDEAVYPWLTARGRLESLVSGRQSEGPPEDWDLKYLVHPVQSIEEMARQIIEAFRAHITPSGATELWLEPGRYVVNKGVHLLLRVADIKGDAIAITDGGTNLLGWERLESEHCPLINLSQPALSQHPCRVYGSLCTPHDLWGFTCYGRGLAVGDVLLLPAQGAYVQTLAQRFIKPVCQTVYLDSDGAVSRVQATETLADRYPQLNP